MHLFVSLVLLRTGVFAEERFLGRLVDGWAADAESFTRNRLPHLIIVALLGFILSRLLRLVTARMIRIAGQYAPEATHVSQVKTLAGVIHTTGIAIIGLIVGLQFLDAVGINLAPLLASAGVAGIALGLAAQNIVRDMLNGVLILIEDQFDVGDTVRIAGLAGTVEAMTLRKTTVRDADGTLYVIPNSQITTVANQSVGYSVATVNVSVDFSANPDRVVELLKGIANEIRESEQFRGVFVADPQVLGVDAIKGSELIFPVVFKTLATKQYEPVREFRRRVRLALEEQGLLPGDPNRVFNTAMNTVSATGKRPVAEAGPQHDPTTLKPHEGNPFTGE
ncbi:MAG: mechanosensitive ion channel family protein [Terracidiphilus sp.]|jgi:small conductance mechanosensitive channel